MKIESMVTITGAEYEALRAEVERLKEQCETPFMDGYETAKEEYRPRLIASEAEVERLGRDYQTARDAHDGVLLENERLQAALRFYADGGNWIGPFRAPPAVYDGGKIARAALKERRT
jgi:hypothetical protein